MIWLAVYFLIGFGVWSTAMVVAIGEKDRWRFRFVDFLLSLIILILWPYQLWGTWRAYRDAQR